MPDGLPRRSPALPVRARPATAQDGPAFGRRTLSWGPLGFTAGLHLLLVLAWLYGPARMPVRPAAPRQEAAFVLVAPVGAPRAAPTHERRPHQPARPRADAAHATAIGLPPAQAPRGRAPLQAAQAADEAVPDTHPDHDIPADPTTDNAAFAAPGAVPAATGHGAAGPGDLLATSRRMAGRIDRELRKGGSPITAEPDRKWERFADAVAGARVAPAGDVTLAVHTAPDGVTIYRKTLGTRVRCYRSGSVGGPGPADGQSAGNIPCPTGVSWTRL